MEHTRENIDSNPLAMQNKNNVRRVSGDKVTNFTFQQKSPTNNDNVEPQLFSSPKPLNSKKIQTFGTIIKWTKGSRLGFGVFGDVVKAMDKQNGEIIAVKRLGLVKNQDEYNKEAIESLKAEMNILKEVSHENIIRYIGAEIIKDDF